jgi:hypothetical protein
LKRQEAVEVLKEILESCKLLDPSYLSLHLSKQPDSYELHIKNHVAAASWNILKEIVQKHGLAMREYDGFLVVYSPEKES